jgi:hypothetical protein
MRHAHRPLHLLLLTLAVAAASAIPGDARAQSPTAAPRGAAAARPFVVEYSYRIRWGHFDEWMELYKRNHWPILERQQRMGRIVSMSAVYPVNHAGEASRWDLRFTIVWKDAATAHDDFDDAPVIRELYPDQAKFRAEEQRRFELLLEHTDVPVRVEDPATWRR